MYNFGSGSLSLSDVHAIANQILSVFNMVMLNYLSGDTICCLGILFELCMFHLVFCMSVMESLGLPILCDKSVYRACSRHWGRGGVFQGTFFEKKGILFAK